MEGKHAIKHSSALRNSTVKGVGDVMLRADRGQHYEKDMTRRWPVLADFSWYSSNHSFCLLKSPKATEDLKMTQWSISLHWRKKKKKKRGDQSPNTNSLLNSQRQLRSLPPQGRQTVTIWWGIKDSKRPPTPLQLRMLLFPSRSQQYIVSSG